MKQNDDSGFSRREFLGWAGAAAGIATIAAVGLDQEQQVNLPSINVDAFTQEDADALASILAEVFQRCNAA